MTPYTGLSVFRPPAKVLTCGLNSETQPLNQPKISEKLTNRMAGNDQNQVGFLLVWENKTHTHTHKVPTAKLWDMLDTILDNLLDHFATWKKPGPLSLSEL